MRVLVVEGEHKVARVVKLALEQEGYTVEVAYDNESGTALAVGGNYDIAIVDRAVSGAKDGLTIVKAIRTANIHAPVLLLGAAKTASERTASLDAGADDYLHKPFGLEELLARVRRLLNDPSEEQTILSIGDLTLDTVTYEVKRAGKHVPLTSKEFALLEFMLRRPGRPLNKDMIINHVWDYDADILPNTVEVYIKYLRNKVDEPFDKPLIHTLRGFGYKVEV